MKKKLIMNNEKNAEIISITFTITVSIILYLSVNHQILSNILMPIITWSIPTEIGLLLINQLQSMHNENLINKLNHSINKLMNTKKFIIENKNQRLITNIIIFITIILTGIKLSNINNQILILIWLTPYLLSNVLIIKNQILTNHIIQTLIK